MVTKKTTKKAITKKTVKKTNTINIEFIRRKGGWECNQHIKLQGVPSHIAILGIKRLLRELQEKEDEQIAKLE